MLERLYRLASTHRHPSARVFALAIADEKERAFNRKRLGEMCDPRTIREAIRRLEAACAALELNKELARLSTRITPATLAGLDEVKEKLLTIADLLCIGGREDITGGKK
jgi:hypothetical protein